MKLQSLFGANAEALSTFDSVVEVRDPNEIDSRSLVSGRLFGDSTLGTYLLQERSLLRSRFADPITIVADRRLESMVISLCASRFEINTGIGGEGIDSYSCTMMLQGTACWIQRDSETVVSGSDGAALRLRAGTRAQMNGNNARRHLWIRANALEHAVEALLGMRLQKPLEVKRAVDWSRGLAASLRSELDFLTHEMTPRDGVADNPVALASLTDLVFLLLLHVIPHNHRDYLSTSPTSATPAYVRRAEEFMRANAAMPVRMEQVADAAGCSVRTLGAIFRRFRETTPLPALHMIRRDQVRLELSRGSTNGSTAEVARRHGLTSPSRFAIAYRRRFREAPRGTVRHSQH